MKCRKETKNALPLDTERGGVEGGRSRQQAAGRGGKGGRHVVLGTGGGGVGCAGAVRGCSCAPSTHAVGGHGARGPAGSLHNLRVAALRAGCSCVHTRTINQCACSVTPLLHTHPMRPACSRNMLTQRAHAAPHPPHARSVLTSLRIEFAMASFGEQLLASSPCTPLVRARVRAGAGAGCAAGGVCAMRASARTHEAALGTTHIRTRAHTHTQTRTCTHAHTRPTRRRC